MGLYRIYVDEVCHHDLTHTDDPNHRFLSLTGVILESGYVRDVLQPEMGLLKRTYFRHDPDEPVVFHRTDIVNKRHPFESLRDAPTEDRFNADLLACLARWEYRVITVVIDKKEYQEKYKVWKYDPYHYCLHVLMERYVLDLKAGGCTGDAMVESRGGREDMRLKASYSALYESGNKNLPVHLWGRCLTSGELKAKPKKADIAGLQIADLIAHPSRREVLLDHHLMADERSIFGDRVCEILRQSKYRRNSRTGTIEGYGKKLLP